MENRKYKRKKDRRGDKQAEKQMGTRDFPRGGAGGQTPAATFLKQPKGEEHRRGQELVLQESRVAFYNK